MRRGFTLLEVLLASIMLGLGLAALLVSFSQSRKAMYSSDYLSTAQMVMDWGESAYPLKDVTDPEDGLDIREVKASELWETIAGPHGPKLTKEQQEKIHHYTWERERVVKRMSDEDLKRMGNIYPVRVTVSWGDGFMGDREKESYVVLWRKSE